VIAANPGPAMHMALLGIVIVIGLIVFAIIRVRHKREAAEAEKPDQTDAGNERRRHEHHDRTGAGHHHSRAAEDDMQSTAHDEPFAARRASEKQNRRRPDQ